MSRKPLANCLWSLRKMLCCRKTNTQTETFPTRGILDQILNPLSFTAAFIGFKSSYHPYLSKIGMPLWLMSMGIHFSLDFYEAYHIFGIAWATSIGVFLVSFLSGTFFAIKDVLPWLEDSLEILYAEGNFTESLEKVHVITKKLPWVLPGCALLGACGQYVCYFVDDAVQLELSKGQYDWLTPVLNVARVLSLLHVLYGYFLFLFLILLVMYITGLSMNEFRDGVEGEFREKQVRLTFREAVQLFEHRTQFIKRSSNAVQVFLIILELTTVLSFVINAYNFMFLKRLAIYLWFALVPLVWSVTPLLIAAWATETYQSYVISVIKSWGEHPEDDESGSEGEEMDEYQEAIQKLQVNKSKSLLIASTKLLKNLQQKRLVLKQDRRLSTALRRESLALPDQTISPLPGQMPSDYVLNPNNPLRVIDVDATSDAGGSDTGSVANTHLLAGNFLHKRRQCETHPEKKSKFNFKTYVMYLQGLIPSVGFSIAGIILTWEKVSTLGVFLISLLAVFIQEIVFGNRKNTFGN